MISTFILGLLSGYTTGTSQTEELILRNWDGDISQDITNRLPSIASIPHL